MRAPPATPGPHHRRLRADGEHVRADGRERPDLARHARDAEQPRDEQHAARDERDVLARDGEQVVEPRGTERVPQVFVEPFVLAEHDPEQHGTPLTGDTRRERGADRRPEPVSHAAEASAATDDLGDRDLSGPRGRRAAKPRSLVEAVVGRTSARRRAPASRARRPEAATGPPAAGAGPARGRRGRRSARRARVCRIAYCVRRAGPVTTRGRRRHARSPPTSGLRSIASSRSEPHHQPAEHQSQREQREPCARQAAATTAAERRPAAVRSSASLRASVGSRDAGTEAREQQMRHVEREPLDHGTTSSRSSSIVAGPIPAPRRAPRRTGRRRARCGGRGSSVR